MDIAVIGLGYVGSVSSGCLAKLGHRVIGVDVDATKIGKMANGQAPIVEPGLDELVAVGHVEGRIKATHDIEYTLDTFESIYADVIAGYVDTAA